MTLTSPNKLKLVIVTSGPSPCTTSITGSPNSTTPSVRSGSPADILLVNPTAEVARLIRDIGFDGNPLRRRRTVDTTRTDQGPLTPRWPRPEAYPGVRSAGRRQRCS